MLNILLAQRLIPPPKNNAAWHLKGVESMGSCPTPLLSGHHKRRGMGGNPAVHCPWLDEADSDVFEMQRIPLWLPSFVCLFSKKTEVLILRQLQRPIGARHLCCLCTGWICMWKEQPSAFCQGNDCCWVEESLLFSSLWLFTCGNTLKPANLLRRKT